MREPSWLQSASATFREELRGPSLTETQWQGEVHYHNTYVTKVENPPADIREDIAHYKNMERVAMKAVLIGLFALGIVLLWVVVK